MELILVGASTLLTGAIICCLAVYWLKYMLPCPDAPSRRMAIILASLCFTVGPLAVLCGVASIIFGMII